MVSMGPHALEYSLVFLLIGGLFLASAAFYLDLSDYDPYWKHNPNRPWIRAKGLLVGVPFTFIGGYALVEYVVVTHHNSVLMRSADPIGLGWKDRAVALYQGERFWNAAVASDGSVFALTGTIKAGGSGSWLYHLDPKGRLLPSFGEGGVASVYDYAPVARALAYDEMHRRIYIASEFGTDVQEDVSIYELRESGADHTRAAELKVARPKSSPGVAATGTVALSVGDDGALIAVVRADSPGPNGSQLAAFRIDYVSGVDSYGGDLVKLPTQCGSDGDLSLARGPKGEIYIGTSDGLRTWVMRLGETGHLDTSFGKDGLVELDQPGYSTMVATPAGLVVAGNGGGYRFTMRRVRYDGTVDEEFAKALRAHPLALREKEHTGVSALAFAIGSLWVELGSLDRVSGRRVSAIVRFSESGEEEGGPVYLENEVPPAPSDRAAGLWPLGDDRLLAALETGPARPASVNAVPQKPSQVYLRPLEIPKLVAAAARAPVLAPGTDSDEPPTPAVAAAPSTPAPAAPAEAPSGSSAVFYSYTDHGVVHVASSLDKVPAALRSTAHAVR